MRGLLFTLLTTACATTPEPTRLEDCAAVTDAVARGDCQLKFTTPLLEDPKALDAALALVPEGVERDALIARLAVTDPRRGARLCKAMTTPEGQQKCQQVLGRPHLGAPRKTKP